MPLPQDITSAWEATNHAGGALASALHALRSDAVETPHALRRPSERMTANDQLGEALLLVSEAKRHAAAASLRIGVLEDQIQQQLATR